ncbi:ASCH domain-containing protein [Clostridium sp.]|uniref:ASCH domain-containing protein n=1 Tax=Clostridium sp. TaxID=1506 RepID=UPI003D6C9BEB
MKVLLSIKPEFVEKILSGSKKYEYRRRLFKKEVESVLIYSTKPEGVVVGEFTIEKLICKDKKELWRESKEFSGIGYKHYQNYFKGCKEACAIQIKSVYIYKTPKMLSEIKMGLKAPQSFCYIYEDSEFICTLL